MPAVLENKQIAMKDIVKQMSVYNIWANQKLIDTSLSLPPEKQMAEVPSSFNSLYGTFMHMWDAESMWWQRLKLQERVIRPSDNFKGNLVDVTTGLLQQNNQWNDWINGASELALEHVFQYQNSKKEMFKQPVYQVLLHIFNHGTYHRGQIVNILRQLSVEKIPQTDFIVWSRKR